MKVSRHAARQAPTKLGLRVGRTITVEEAIKGICTKSANDAAVVIAERLGGTESGFAAKMTTKARQIGMAHTTFVNASGLPDARQVTTARDIAVLSERLIEDFPQYYHYFQTAGMTWGKRYIANHNHLIGEVEGVDGIKTGYTNASGYNLASAVLRHGTRIVAVVMGGETAAARDAQMTYLIENAYDELDARSTSQTATLTGMPITKATVDFTNGTVRTQTAGQDRVQYSAPAPSTASLISGSSIAAAPIAGAPVSAGASMIDQIADSKGLF
jgi:D-alanyl-D-alanine carboxypeptidase